MKNLLSAAWKNSSRPKIGQFEFVTTNPGVWYDAEEGQIKLLYRAAGDEEAHIIRFGLAVSPNGYDFTRVSEQPVFGPSIDGFDAGCVEDPRIVKIGDYYYITYAARFYPPGRYWMAAGKPKVWRQSPPEFPLPSPPEEWYEIGGCYDGGGVVFPCGKVVIRDTLFVYYGAADKYIGLATCKLDELLDYLLNCPAT